MKVNMTYQKPCLHNIAGKIAALCSQGSGATGANLGTQCNTGTGADVDGPIASCQSGSGDGNDFAFTCDAGTSVSVIGACSAGPGAG
ncbi:MAG: hypothetical protein KAS17_11185 [Victivallaceae bacterium]|nr:hypothetical protein [Victivallaceae bacterium]